MDWISQNFHPEAIRQVANTSGTIPKEYVDEWFKCKADICYWFSKYLKSYDPREADHGNAYAPFILFPHQIEFLHWLDERVAAREGGFVTLGPAACWRF